MFEPKVFRKQMYWIEESTYDIVETFQRPVNCVPVVTPLVVTSDVPTPHHHSQLLQHVSDIA